MSYVRRCMVPSAEVVVLARFLSARLAEGGAGEGMFLFPTSPTGAEPATRFLTEGPIGAEFAAIIDTKDPAGLLYACRAKGLTDADNRVIDPDLAAIVGEGIDFTGPATHLLLSCDVSQDEPFAAMERMGLKPVLQEESP